MIIRQSIIRFFYSEIVLLLSITHLFCHAGELPLLTAQLDQLAKQEEPEKHAAHLKQIRTIDWSKIPCITHDINILAPRELTKKNSILFNKNDAKCGLAVEIVQPIVTWQEFVAEDLVATNISTAEKLLKVGFPVESHMEFLNIFKKNSPGVEAHQKEFSSHPDYPLGGGQASCGYHALAHAQTIIDHIISTKEITNLLSLKHINDLFGFAEVRIILNPNNKTDGPWRLLIKKARQKLQNKDEQSDIANESGDWLGLDGLDIIIKEITSKNNYQSNITLPNMRISPNDLYQSLKNRIQPKDASSSITGIIVHASSSSIQQQKSAHWFSVVIIRSTHLLQIIILDSKNYPRFDHETVQAIIVNATGIDRELLSKRLQVNQQDEKTFEGMNTIAELSAIRASMSLGQYNRQRQLGRLAEITQQQWYQAGLVNLLPITEIPHRAHSVIIRELLLKGASEDDIRSYFRNMGMPPPTSEDLQVGRRSFQAEIQ